MKKKIFRYFVPTILILGALVWFFGFRGDKVPVFQSEKVQTREVKQTVLATGTVTSGVDLNLAFKSSGIVKRVNVKVGSKVKENDVLAQLDQRDAQASVSQARAQVASAQANIDKLKEGATSEEVLVAQVALDNAKKNLSDTIVYQEVLVKNAKNALLSIGLEAKPYPNNSSTTVPTISGKYTGGTEGDIAVEVLSANDGIRFNLSGLAGGGAYIFAGVPIPLGNTGLSIQFASGTYQSGDKWTISIPNTLSSSYVTYLNAYNAALETQRTAIATAENAVSTAEANLNLKKAQARPSDLSAAEASLLSAKASLEAALANLENTVVRAPTGGTVTKVDVKLGEQATALSPVVTIQDVENLYVEANVSEANIASLKLGQMVSYTFDALGQTREFFGKISNIEPSSTVIGGVVNYKISANFMDQEVSLDQDGIIKPGMTANLSILIAERPNVLAVPLRAIVQKNGTKYVRVVLDPKKAEFEERPVVTGLEADGGLVEILSGIKSGEEVVTYIEEAK